MWILNIDPNMGHFWNLWGPNMGHLKAFLGGIYLVPIRNTHHYWGVVEFYQTDGDHNLCTLNV